MVQSVEEGRQAAVPMVLVHVGLGGTNQTFRWLDRVLQEHDHYLLDLKVEPLWAPLRDEPRFRALLLKLELEKGMLPTTPQRWG